MTLDPHLGYRAGRLFAESVALERIAKETGTPAYVYSARAVRERYRELDAAFGGTRHRICFALKANPNRALCALLAKEGAGADVVSGGELKRALAAGVPPGKIVFAGVGKTKDEIAFALRAGVRSLNVESLEELDAVAAQAKRQKRRAPFSVRVNPAVDAGTHRHIATGLPDSKFGVDAKTALGMYRKARRSPWLAAVGIHSHIGSQISRLEPYRKALGALLDLAAVLKREGQRLEVLDLGGGIGVKYDHETPLPILAYARMVAHELRAWPELELCIEPGRFLTAEAGLLLTRVLYRKKGPKLRMAVVDAGMNDLLRPALYGARHPIVPTRAPGRKTMKLDVVGPVCESSDVFLRAEPLPWPEPGELWAILKTGAYGHSMSSQYNSRPRPPEVLVDGSRFRVIRTRETFADLVRHER